MKIAPAIQAGFDHQRRHDIERLSYLERIQAIARSMHRECDADARPQELVLVRRVPCETCLFWRDRYDDANAEVDDLRDQLRRHGITPKPRQDGQQASFGPLTA